MLAERWRGLSRFEAFCWRWFHGNVNGTVIEAGLLGRALDRLGLSPFQEKLLLRAVHQIRTFFLDLELEEARR